MYILSLNTLFISLGMSMLYLLWLCTKNCKRRSNSQRTPTKELCVSFGELWYKVLQFWGVRKMEQKLKLIWDSSSHAHIGSISTYVLGIDCNGSCDSQTLMRCRGDIESVTPLYDIKHTR